MYNVSVKLNESDRSLNNSQNGSKVLFSKEGRDSKDSKDSRGSKDSNKKAVTLKVEVEKKKGVTVNNYLSNTNTNNGNSSNANYIKIERIPEVKRKEMERKELKEKQRAISADIKNRAQKKKDSKRKENNTTNEMEIMDFDNMESSNNKSGYKEVNVIKNTNNQECETDPSKISEKRLTRKMDTSKDSEFEDRLKKNSFISDDKKKLKAQIVSKLNQNNAEAQAKINALNMRKAYSTALNYSIKPTNKNKKPQIQQEEPETQEIEIISQEEKYQKMEILVKNFEESIIKDVQKEVIKKSKESNDKLQKKLHYLKENNMLENINFDEINENEINIEMNEDQTGEEEQENNIVVQNSNNTNSNSNTNNLTSNKTLSRTKMNFISSHRSKSSPNAFSNKSKKLKPQVKTFEILQQIYMERKNFAETNRSQVYMEERKESNSFRKSNSENNSRQQSREHSAGEDIPVPSLMFSYKTNKREKEEIKEFMAKKKAIKKENAIKLQTELTEKNQKLLMNLNKLSVPRRSTSEKKKSVNKENNVNNRSRSSNSANKIKNEMYIGHKPNANKDESTILDTNDYYYTVFQSKNIIEKKQIQEIKSTVEPVNVTNKDDDLLNLYDKEVIQSLSNDEFKKFLEDQKQATLRSLNSNEMSSAKSAPKGNINIAIKPAIPTVNEIKNKVINVVQRANTLIENSNASNISIKKVNKEMPVSVVNTKELPKEVKDLPSKESSRSASRDMPSKRAPSSLSNGPSRDELVDIPHTESIKPVKSAYNREPVREVSKDVSIHSNRDSGIIREAPQVKETKPKINEADVKKFVKLISIASKRSTLEDLTERIKLQIIAENYHIALNCFSNFAKRDAISKIKAYGDSMLIENYYIAFNSFSNFAKRFAFGKLKEYSSNVAIFDEENIKAYEEVLNLLTLFAKRNAFNAILQFGNENLEEQEVSENEIKIYEAIMNNVTLFAKRDAFNKLKKFAENVELEGYEDDEEKLYELYVAILNKVGNFAKRNAFYEIAKVAYNIQSESEMYKSMSMSMSKSIKSIKSINRSKNNASNNMNRSSNKSALKSGNNSMNNSVRVHSDKSHSKIWLEKESSQIENLDKSNNNSQNNIHFEDHSNISNNMKEQRKVTNDYDYENNYSDNNFVENISDNIIPSDNNIEDMSNIKHSRNNTYTNDNNITDDMKIEKYDSQESNARLAKYNKKEVSIDAERSKSNYSRDYREQSGDVSGYKEQSGDVSELRDNSKDISRDSSKVISKKQEITIQESVSNISLSQSQRSNIQKSFREKFNKSAVSNKSNLLSNRSNLSNKLSNKSKLSSGKKESSRSKLNISNASLHSANKSNINSVSKRSYVDSNLHANITNRTNEKMNTYVYESLSDASSIILYPNSFESPKLHKIHELIRRQQQEGRSDSNRDVSENEYSQNIPRQLDEYNNNYDQGEEENEENDNENYIYENNYDKNPSENEEEEEIYEDGFEKIDNSRDVSQSKMINYSKLSLEDSKSSSMIKVEKPENKSFNNKKDEETIVEEVVEEIREEMNSSKRSKKSNKISAEDNNNLAPEESIGEISVEPIIDKSADLIEEVEKPIEDKKEYNTMVISGDYSVPEINSTDRRPPLVLLTNESKDEIQEEIVEDIDIYNEHGKLSTNRDRFIISNSDKLLDSKLSDNDISADRDLSHSIDWVNLSKSNSIKDNSLTMNKSNKDILNDKNENNLGDIQEAANEHSHAENILNENDLKDIALTEEKEVNEEKDPVPSEEKMESVQNLKDKSGSNKEDSGYDYEFDNIDNFEEKEDEDKDIFKIIADDNVPVNNATSPTLNSGKSRNIKDEKKKIEEKEYSYDILESVEIESPHDKPNYDEVSKTTSNIDFSAINVPSSALNAASQVNAKELIDSQSNNMSVNIIQDNKSENNLLVESERLILDDNIESNYDEKVTIEVDAPLTNERKNTIESDDNYDYIVIKNASSNSKIMNLLDDKSSRKDANFNIYSPSENKSINTYEIDNISSNHLAINKINNRYGPTNEDSERKLGTERSSVPEELGEKLQELDLEGLAEELTNKLFDEFLKSEIKDSKAVLVPKKVIKEDLNLSTSIDKSAWNDSMMSANSNKSYFKKSIQEHKKEKALNLYNEEIAPILLTKVVKIINDDYTTTINKLQAPYSHNPVDVIQGLIYRDQNLLKNSYKILDEKNKVQLDKTTILADFHEVNKDIRKDDNFISDNYYDNILNECMIEATNEILAKER